MKSDNLQNPIHLPKRRGIWIGIGIFTVLIVSVLIYQQIRKQEFIHYLEEVESCFISIDSLQELSLKANQAGISGDHVREMELTGTMIQRSEEFLKPFEAITVRSRTLQAIHARLLELNQATHRLLIYRSEAIRRMQDNSLSAEEKQTEANEFWAFQEKNKTLFRSVSEDLQAYGKRVGVDPAAYLKHLL